MVLVVPSKGLHKRLKPVVKKGYLNFGKQALKSRVQVLDDVSRGADVKRAIKRGAVKRAKKMAKKSISRSLARKTVSRKRTVKGSRPSTINKKRVSANLL